MTGYGRGSAPLGSRSVTVQVSSVNRRTLDLSISLPDEWEQLEPEVASRIRAAASRGKVNVAVEAAAAPGADAGLEEAAVGAEVRKLAALAAAHGIPFQPTVELLWQIANAQRAARGLPAGEAARAAVLAALDAALGEFAAMREREGAVLLADFRARLERLAQQLEIVAARAPAVPIGYRELLLRRLREAGLELDLSDERVLKEIALFADRSDLSEELTRFRSHLAQLADLLGSSGEIGRKAEFLLQELGREAHTMGSKANDLTISRAVLELKNELERVKEQIANVE